VKIICFNLNPQTPHQSLCLQTAIFNDMIRLTELFKTFCDGDGVVHDDMWNCMMMLRERLIEVSLILQITDKAWIVHKVTMQIWCIRFDLKIGNFEQGRKSLLKIKEDVDRGVYRLSPDCEFELLCYEIRIIILNGDKQEFSKISTLLAKQKRLSKGQIQIHPVLKLRSVSYYSTLSDSLYDLSSETGRLGPAKKACWAALGKSNHL
jgi:hypothetical protein